MIINRVIKIKIDNEYQRTPAQTQPPPSQADLLNGQPFELRPELHRHCEPRGKFNIVKINKSKLPLDFFPKQ